MIEFGREVVLKNEELEIAVAPEMGFSVVGFRWRGLEILDPRSKADFLAVRKGLGPLILPHFNQFASAPQIDKKVFPHIPILESRGVSHPFQHGIGRYVPWKYDLHGDSIHGMIDGGMSYNGYTLSELNGFDFSARVAYTMTTDGIEVAFDVRGEHPVAAGIHFYYALSEKAKTSVVLPESSLAGALRLHFDEPLDRRFAMKEAQLKTEAVCTLETPKYSLMTCFPTGGAPVKSFDTLIVFCPADATFVCIEPISYRVGDQNKKNHFLGRIRLRLAAPAAIG
jgi:galactose mutarotase-like enzyme